jgi:hypothetical protein
LDRWKEYAYHLDIPYGKHDTPKHGIRPWKSFHPKILIFAGIFNFYSFFPYKADLDISTPIALLSLRANLLKYADFTHYL